MIDFPASPTLGQPFTAAGVTWTFDGVKWLPAGLAPTVVGGINDNRLINGDMRIDQRNNGASGTANGYTVDRWNWVSSPGGKITWGRNLNAATGPAGFPYYLGLTTSTVYTPAAGDFAQLLQPIEADMASDFAWGSAGAQPVTLSFWVASSNLGGTYSGAVGNVAGTRSYPFSFSIAAANTWYKVVVTIPGDTVGAWVMSGNAGSVAVKFDLGSGSTFRGPANAWAATNYIGVTGAVSLVANAGATFYVTGVKLEIGSVATPFNRQSLAKSMADCQRYYISPITGVGLVILANTSYGGVIIQSYFPPMRAAPTVTYITVTPGSGFVGTVASNGITPASFFTQAASSQTSAIASVTFGATLSAEL